MRSLISLLLTSLIVQKTFQIDQIMLSTSLGQIKLNEFSLWSFADLSENNEKEVGSNSYLFNLDEDDFSIENNENNKTRFMLVEESENMEFLLESANENEGEFVNEEISSPENNQEGEIFKNEEEEEGGGVVIVESESDDDKECPPLIVENYVVEEAELPEEYICTVEDGIEACVGGATTVILNCESIKRCTNIYVPRVGFQCMCKVETHCVETY